MSSVLTFILIMMIIWILEFIFTATAAKHLQRKLKVFIHFIVYLHVSDNFQCLHTFEVCKWLDNCLVN